MSNVKKFKVSIFGTTYSLVSDEAQELLIEAAKLIDVSMKESAKNSSSISAKNLAILAALSSTIKALKAQQELTAISRAHEKILNSLADAAGNID